MWYNKYFSPFAFFDEALDKQNGWSPLFASAVMYLFMLLCGLMAEDSRIISLFDDGWGTDYYYRSASLGGRVFFAWFCSCLPFLLFMIENFVNARRFLPALYRFLIGGGFFLLLIVLGAFLPGAFEILGAIGLVLVLVAAIIGAVHRAATKTPESA